VMSRFRCRMAEASRGSKRNALTQYCNEIKEDDRSRVYRFQILLPSGVNRRLTSHDPSEEISVKRELDNIHWDCSKFPHCTSIV